MGECLGHEVVQDLDALVDRVLLFPGRGFHLGVAGAHHDLDLGPAEAACGAATVHRGVAAAENHHSATDLVGVAKEHARQPLDADPHVVGGLPAAGNVKVSAVRGAAADEDRVIAFAEQRLEAVDAPGRDERAACRQGVADLFVNHFVG